MDFSGRPFLHLPPMGDNLARPSLAAASARSLPALFECPLTHLQLIVLERAAALNSVLAVAARAKFVFGHQEPVVMFLAYLLS